MTREPVDFELSAKYGCADAEYSVHKQPRSLSRKLSAWREVQVARKALMYAGEPGLVLDLPCGAGRFWPMLSEKTNRQIIAADNSVELLAVACKSHPAAVARRVKPMVTSAFSIELPDGSVDSIFNMRLLQYIPEAADRARLLKEFHRVTRDTVVLSLWVDGNYNAWKNARDARRGAVDGRHYQLRLVIPTKTIEAEFKVAGFTIQEHLDLLPMYAMRRIYILRKG